MRRRISSGFYGADFRVLLLGFYFSDFQTSDNGRDFPAVFFTLSSGVFPFGVIAFREDNTDLLFSCFGVKKVAKL